MIDPDSSANAGFTIQKTVSIKDWDNDGASLAAGIEHPILQYVDASELRLTEYIQVSESSLDRYDVLLYYQGNPVFFLRDQDDSKIAVFSFDIHKSTFNMSPYFSMLMGCFFDYFLPVTFEDKTYSVYDTVSLNERGTNLTVIDTANEATTFETVPTDYVITAPGTYVFTQKLMSGKVISEYLYVKIAAEESNITKTVDVLQGPTIEQTAKFSYQDLMIYFVVAIVVLLCVEWLLHMKSGV
jgi:hypothetical protein